MSSYNARKREWAEALVRAVHGGPDDPELTSESGFDGGVQPTTRRAWNRVRCRYPASHASSAGGTRSS